MLSDGDTVTVGAPTVAGAKVTATVISPPKSKRVKGYTYKKIKGVQRHYGPVSGKRTAA